jgi:hypothetical protein
MNPLSLVLATTFALNPHPVNLAGRLHFSGEKQLRVLAGGNAGIEIDVTKLIPPKLGVAYFERRDEIKMRIPPGSVHAELKRRDGSIVVLTYMGFTGERAAELRIMLDAAKPLVDGETFDGVDVIVERPLRDVTVFWREAQK